MKNDNCSGIFLRVLGNVRYSLVVMKSMKLHIVAKLRVVRGIKMAISSRKWLSFLVTVSIFVIIESALISLLLVNSVI